MKSSHLLAVVAIGFAGFFSSAIAGAERISWSALRPSHQSGRAVPPAGVLTGASELGDLVWRDATRQVQLTGFIVPIDQDGDLVYEFMLVPWAGACSHSASPPPNQLVHVFPEKPYRSTRIYEAITVTGSLQAGIDKAQLFIMDGTRVLTYGYSMRAEDVAQARQLSDPDVRALPPGGILSR